jgi:N-acyl-D-amino-acid deacylase
MSRHHRVLAGVVLPAALAAGAVTQSPRYDLLVRGGRVVDGTGAPARPADVAVAGGRIAAVGSIDPGLAREVIDATGLVVAPGFIDVHTHADAIAERPLAEHFVRMGVTTVVAGNCGSSPVDIGAALAAIEWARPAPNVATLVGHGSVRREVMGTARRAPTSDELARMEQLVAKAMADGAVGLSTGLQYVPGTYAEPDEIVALARVAAAAGGLYATHMRNEGTALEAAVAESIAVGERAGCPVQISHLKVDAPSHWGASARALALIDAARARGVQVAADQYLYDAASSTLGIRFPSWALEGGEKAIAERLNDQATWARIREEMKALIAERGLKDYAFARIASYGADPALNGLAIPEAARRVLGDGSLDGQLELMRRMLLAGGASMVYQFMSEDDIARILRHPQVAIASDSGLNVPGEGVPHPRGYGNTARALARYVRDRQVVTLEEAIRKMTSLPASLFGFEGRGRIEPGAWADLVVFDPAAVADRATYEAPHQYPAGIPHVVVNGVPVVRAGELTGARPGQVIRHRRAG